MTKALIDKIANAIRVELSLYNLKLKQEGGQDTDFYIKWKNTVIDVIRSVSDIIGNIFDLMLVVYFDVNYEYLESIYIYDKKNKLLKSEQIGFYEDD